MSRQSAVTKTVNRFFGILCTAWTVTFASPGAAQVVLPDFTVLVEQNAPAIVFVSTVYSANNRVNAGDRADLENLLRYFYGDQLELPEPEEPERGGASGSGFIIDASGFVVTNHHVIDGAESVTVTLNDQREFTATIVGSDERSDLAVLKINASNLPTVRLGNSENLKVGEWVLAIGSPFGLQYSVAAGIISYMGRSLPANDGKTGYVSYIQTDVAINPGHSGGPLFNLAGEVVGINSQIFTDSGGGSIGLSFAIPVDVAKNVVSQLRESGAVVRGWMGVGIEDVNQDLADAFNLNAPHGALVNKIIEGSPAEAAGFATGDIIVRFNGHDIRTSADLPYFVGLLRPGTEVDVEVIRNGNPRTLEMLVGDLDAGAVTQSSVMPEDIGRLGLKVSALNVATRTQLGIVGGVKVESVRGAAQTARLQPGDIILTLNGIELNSPEDLTALEANLPANRPLPVLVLRDQGQTFFTIRIDQ